MSDAEKIELKAQDRITQAGILIVEQLGLTLLLDSYKFPEPHQGKMKTVANDGTLKIEGPVNELLKSSMIKKKDDKSTYFGIWNHTEITDPAGHKSSSDEVMGGDFLVVLVNNRLATHTDFKGENGDLQLKMDGQSMFTPRDGVTINDLINTVTDANGNYLGEFHLTAKSSKPNMLEINASYKYHELYLGDVEAHINLDPEDLYRSASFEVEQKYNPPPPPPIAVPSNYSPSK
ncbi:MAG: hypothetical protein K2X27_00645 [Candidatus Obscuribacterales bacterium]|nr:hypothetical protein [Candidatus Obscuribacterales bacterium]